LELKGKTIVKETTITFSCSTCPTLDGYEIDKSWLSRTTNDFLHLMPDLFPSKIAMSPSLCEHVFIQNIVSEYETFLEDDP